MYRRKASTFVPCGRIWLCKAVQNRAACEEVRYKPVSMKSNLRFGRTVDVLCATAAISRRELIRRLQKRGVNLSNSELQRMASEETVPRPKAMEAIARFFGEDPRCFVEYRMWLIRRDYDPEEVGFTEALRNLHLHEEGKAAGDGDEIEIDPLELARRLEAEEAAQDQASSA